MDNSSISGKRELSMRAPRELYHMTPIVYSCELDVCPACGAGMKAAYISGQDGADYDRASEYCVSSEACSDPSCVRQDAICKPAGWQQLAPYQGTYGHHVVAYIS
jgi:hypothetical protein